MSHGRWGLVVAALVAGAACTPYVQGNGVFLEEPRSVGAFRGIAVQDGILAAVTVTPDAAQSVTVSGDANVVEQVSTKVIADTVLGIQILEVRVVASDFSSVHPLRVDVRVPAFEAVKVQDATHVEVHGASATRFTVDARDGSSVVLDGTGGAGLEVTLAGGQHGGARLDAHAYPVTDAQVTLTDSSQVVLAASGTIEGTATTGCLVENRSAGTCAVVDATTAAAFACTPSL